MANQVAKKDERKVLPLNAVAKLSSFVDGEGQTREYLDIRLVDPFKTGELGNVEIALKWKYDSSGFRVKAKRLLKSREEFELTGECYPVSYFNRKKKKQRSYAGLFFNDPFGGEKNIEFTVKRDEPAGDFAFLASEFFGESLDSESEEQDN